MNPTIAAHQIKLEVKTDVDGKHVIATPSLIDAMRGETLQINSPDGAFRVVFSPWLLKETEHPITTSEVLTFETCGEGNLLCFIKPSGETAELAYKATSSGGVDGAHVIVRR